MPVPPYHLLLHSNPDWFSLSGANLPRLPRKRGVKQLPVLNSYLLTYLLTVCLSNNNNNTNTNDNVYGAVIMVRPLQEVTRCSTTAVSNTDIAVR